MICDMPELQSASKTDESVWSRRISRRARRLSARVSVEGRVEIVVPVGVGEVAIERFINQHRTWIETRVAQWRSLELPTSSFPPQTVSLSAIGEHWEIERRPSSQSARLEAGEWRLRLEGEGTAVDWQRLLIGWLKQRGQARVEPQLELIARRHGYRYAALRWGRQRTRWGSCSARGVLSLNVCVLFQTPAVLEYLLCHELAHLRHPNHSAAYWAEVARLCPAWQVQDRQLRAGWRRVPRWLFS